MLIFFLFRLEVHLRKWKSHHAGLFVFRKRRLSRLWAKAICFDEVAKDSDLMLYYYLSC